MNWKQYRNNKLRLTKARQGTTTHYQAVIAPGKDERKKRKRLSDDAELAERLGREREESTRKTLLEQGVSAEEAGRIAVKVKEDVRLSAQEQLREQRRAKPASGKTVRITVKIKVCGGEVKTEVVRNDGAEAEG